VVVRQKSGMDTKPIFAVQMPARQLYYDPEANCHADVFTKFGLEPKDSLSTGYIIGGFYCQRVQKLDFNFFTLNPPQR